MGKDIEFLIVDVEWVSGYLPCSLKSTKITLHKILELILTVPMENLDVTESVIELLYAIDPEVENEDMGYLELMIELLIDHFYSSLYGLNLVLNNTIDSEYVFHKWIGRHGIVLRREEYTYGY